MKSLEQSFKGLYPFRLGTTSFIYPDLYSENVRKLGPYLDEVELLFFESRETNCFPSDHEINELVRLKSEMNLSFNVHLPTDVDVSSPDPTERETAVANLLAVITMTRPLEPVTWTFHIPYDSKRAGGESLWRTYACKALKSLLSQGVSPRSLSVETLMYPADMLKPILEELDLSMCLDVGHVILGGGDPLSVYETFKDRISIIHLHAVRNGSDHLSLDQFEPSDFNKIQTMLKDFSGTVSIEVFSYNDLERSLHYLREEL